MLVIQLILHHFFVFSVCKQKQCVSFGRQCTLVLQCSSQIRILGKLKPKHWDANVTSLAG